MKRLLFRILPFCFFLVGFVSAQTSLCRLEQGVDVPVNCTGTNIGGLCWGNNYKDITFSSPFNSIPAVIVTPRRVSDEGDCVGYATDTVKCFPENITAQGFRLICEGSPMPYSCYPYSGYSTYATASWMALEDDVTSSSCRTESAHRVTPTTCTGTNVGGLCYGSFVKDITFLTAYDTIPHVLVSPEITSSQGDCVGATTDQIYCTPSTITKTGFRLTCNGSPIASACGLYSGWSSLADGGYIVKESTDTCQIESGHMIQVDSGYTKDIVFTKTYTSPPNVIISPEHISVDAGGATDSVTCYADTITTTGFRAHCWGSPINSGGQSLAKFGYIVVDAACSRPVLCDEGEYYCSGQTACLPAGDSCIQNDTSLVLGANNVTPSGAADCPGTYSGGFGLCTTAWKIRVNFSEPFNGTPAVIVAPEKISDIGGCVFYKTDKVLAYAENISSTGFDLRVYGSPVTGTCGTWDGYGTWSTAGWVAIGKRVSSTPQKIVAQSGHDIALGGTVGECPGTFSSSSGGTCTTLWTKHITFATPFHTVPKVVVSGENVSTASGSVSGATDGYRFYPENITTTGFDIRGGGSLGGTQLYILPSKVGYLALGEVVPANEATSIIITKALTGTFTSYDGVCHGTQSGSLCTGYWDKSITFSSSFTSAPQMFASPKISSDTAAGSCVGGATDKIYNTVTNITSLGFLATTHGSPVTGDCGSPWDSGASLATMNWIALGTSQPSITCNNNGTCDGNEGCDCADCDEQVDHCGTTTTGIQMVCSGDVIPSVTTVNIWTDISLTSPSLFDSTCEYRFKMNTPAGSGISAGDYWYYGNEIGVNSIVYIGHSSVVSHINADSKTMLRSNGTVVAGYSVSQIQKRCSSEWSDIDTSSVATFDPTSEYRFRAGTPASFGLTAGDYWYYGNAIGTNNIVHFNHSGVISHINADTKLVYRDNGNLDPGYSITQMQKRTNASSWNTIPFDATLFDTACEYRFKMNTPAGSGISAGDYWYYGNATGTNNLVYVSHSGVIAHINADTKTLFRNNGTTVSGFTVSEIQKRCDTADATASFSITKLLAKSVGGVCPTDASAYVYNLNNVLPNEELCVRLVYNNATTGAISNALITDSLPTGFTRVTNSTKNCLTPRDSSELCSDASGMGGVIGDNGWIGNNFSLTPHAGFYAIPTSKTTGDIMEMGRVRLLTMTHCNWFQSGASALDSTFLNYFYTATTGTEGIITTNNYCYLNPVGGYILGGGNGDHTRSLLGYKNYHYYYCGYGGYSGNSKIVLNSTIPSNSTTNPYTASQACTSDPGYIMTPTPVYNTMLGQRYLYHSVCRYYQSAPTLQWDVYYRSNISFGNTTPSAYCPWLSGYYMNSAYVSPVDLLNTANGKGYIQYKITTPSVAVTNITFPYANLSGDSQTTARSTVTLNIAMYVGACCPLGSAWDSTTNTCIPKTCNEGQYFCAVENICKPANQTCVVTCNNNGTCDGNESCDCPDCTNGGTDDKDKCGLDGSNQQLFCTKDVTASTATTQVGACCPVGKTWNALANACVNICPTGTEWSTVTNTCIPKTCNEGQYFCAVENICKPANQTCVVTCNNNGTCDGNESCDCPDCTNGGTDDKDKCAIIGGTQAICSDDNPSDNKPGACCVPPKQWNSTTNTCVECSNTQAPSELKVGIDEAYITCTGNGDLTKTHFRYRLTKQGSTDVPFVSGISLLGTQVLHTTLTSGTYTVECFYGTGVSVDTTVAPHSCVKTIEVNNTAQGCSRLYPYRGSTLSDEMISSSAFEASFRCGSRQPVAGSVSNPYMFQIGTQPISYLQFDSLISELFNGLLIGPVSTQTQNYSFTSSTTDVSCATKVGGGYSTNSACRLRACAGANCESPETFSVIHSGNLTCTSQNTDVYNIGCNPEAPDIVRNACIQWLRDAIALGSTNVANGVEFGVSFTFNSITPTPVTCIKYSAGNMPGGLNLSDNVVCRATLNNGEKYEIYAADTNGRIDSLQSTAHTVELDRDPPTVADIKYYTDDLLTTEISASSWYNKPIVALAVCSDTPLNESTFCACARTVDSSTTDAAFWSVGIPNNLIGADLMRYTRTIANSLTGTQTVRIVDMAGNQSGIKTLSASLDTNAPLMTVTETGSGAMKTVTLTAQDTESKIWPMTTAPTGATNTQGILYRVGLKTDISILTFQSDCSIPPLYASVAATQVASYPTLATVTIPNIDTSTQVVTYCLRDNAGNTTRGIYPVVSTACFSANNMTTIPNLDTYEDITKIRLSTTLNDNLKYGYTFSENTTDANCFRGILASNVTTLLTNQLTPRTTTTFNWSDLAFVKNSTVPNSSGYYYYVYPSMNTLNITTPPTGTGTKSVVVEGGNIHIKTNIEYTGGDKILLLIARKNSNGQGGDIIVDPSVTRIDATLIADGGALSSSNVSLPGERLVINGRLYSYNTRGGSLTVLSGALIDTTTPKKFSNSTLVSASNLTDAQNTDLERLRLAFSDSSNVCSTHINYQAFTTMTLPALLRRPNNYDGGSCGF